MSVFQQVFDTLRSRPKVWLVTGAAGFIGSNLVQFLLENGQKVKGLDNFSTGRRENLKDVRRCVGERCWESFSLVEGDIRRFEDCLTAVAGVELLLHQAALGSVPRSVAEPKNSHAVNVEGFLNILLAARQAGVGRIVYASSSSVYGDSPQLPKVEDRLGKVLSPYAATKRANELYAESFASVYGMKLLGLRYFNVFGPRQDPLGSYAAVIPRWISNMLSNEPCLIFGDGGTSRDFCYVQNVVQANVLAALVDNENALNQVYNVACGERLSLKELHAVLATGIADLRPGSGRIAARYQDFREGDVKHSLASIKKARDLLGYCPEILVRDGLSLTLRWFAER
jgi:UDP-N-acetylglucosamine 4-epimerase